MEVVAITGAGGFIGSRLMQYLGQHTRAQVRGLFRRAPASRGGATRFVAVQGDVFDRASLRELLRPGCSVVNCVYDASAAPAENIAAIEVLANACLEHRVARMVHCSTAVVVGQAAKGRIDETTPARPRTTYEKTKLEIEQLLSSKAREGFELVILRPTAVFGLGGRNLVKLAASLMRGRRVTNYLLSCLNDRRRMNLVGLENVVAAIAFLLEAGRRFDREVFIVSDDEVPPNNYRDVELGLMREFGIADYAVPRIPCPPAILSMLLKLRGRPLTDPQTTFACDKLLQSGFRKPATFEASLAEFARSYIGSSTQPGVLVS